ncbi:galectin-9-like [Clarias gariepinus]|uniref:galectin-9-like n=1 Tax=Clarias gariepinus TaxID=13013 RepID=UPI00234C4766|nr:galectin-9-like [Clarias gariepinus]
MSSQQPYLNPKLPFRGFIQGGLFDGKTITVTGRVLAGAEGFCVNLQCGTNASSDIALHFNPRYAGNSGHVVCNTLQNSRWGSEQRSKLTSLPRGSDFTLTFLVNRDSYSVMVNGGHFLDFLHRLPVSRVDVISVDGGVEITSISFQNPVASLVAQPSFAQKVQASYTFPGVSATPPPYSSSLAYVLPYKTILQGGLYPGRVITVYGCVNHNADRFCINLSYNSGIAFHFNPRFNENVVVRNSLMNGCWGHEEKSGGLPFYRGQQFTVNITCDTQCYRISVNGIQMFTYNHRHYLLQQIDILEVDGNVTVGSVTV